MLTRQQFEATMDTMQPGESMIYHTGLLALDRSFGANFMRVENVAQAAWEAMRLGKVHLVCSVNAKGDGSPYDIKTYDYLVVKRAKPYQPVRFTGCYRDWSLVKEPVKRESKYKPGTGTFVPMAKFANDGVHREGMHITPVG